MHVSSAALLLGAASLAPLALADESVLDIQRPSFTPTDLTAPFLEQFTDDWESRWRVSQAKRVNDKSSEEEWAYVGKWAVEEPTVLKGIDGDKGLVLKNKAAHHAISSRFPEKIDNTGKTLVLQYEVKLQDGLECGGAYLKLLQDNAALHAEEFSNATPYIIMFGPDKCGSTNKVHFIFRHKNPLTGEYEEKHAIQPVLIKSTKESALYTLIVNPDQSFTIQVDGEDKATGSLLHDFLPAVNPDKQIDDPTDTKPEDWVDDAQMQDPEATKPEDWDEDAPFQIIDESAEKPEDWLEDEPTMIPDPEADKPEDWDDEEDGDWMPPMVPNPRCADVSGCGPWEKPMIKNPAYKGMWSAPTIDNPAYKGIWAPRKIDNPNYYEDSTPANFEPIGGIGFEIWTMQKDILFDNIYIGHSIEDAVKFKNQTFDVKRSIEKKEADAAKPVAEEKPETKSPMDLKFTDDPVHFVREKVELFVTIAKRSPVDAIKFVPEVAGALAVLTIGLVTLLIGALGLGAASSPQVKETVKKSKAEAADEKEQVAEAVATGAENVKADLNKRATHSTGTTGTTDS